MGGTLHPKSSEINTASFLLFSIDSRSPLEVPYLKPADIYQVDIDDYQEELQVSVTSTQKLAVTTIQKSQEKQKTVYDTDQL